MIVGKGWINLPNKSDYIYHGECKICQQRFSHEEKDTTLEVIAYLSPPKICDKKECQDKEHIHQYECYICQKEFNEDDRLERKIRLSNNNIEYGYPNVRFCSEECLIKYEEKVRINREEQEKQRIAEYIGRILPPKYHNLNSDKYEKSLLDKSLFIFGLVGTGKSVLMATIVKEYIKGKYKIKWVAMTDFMMELQSLYRFQHENPYQFAQNIAGYDGILCLDDLGACKCTEFVQQIIYYILDYRESYCLKTIITSNLPLSKIDEMIGERISSRLAGMCEVVEMKGKDRRMEK